MNSENGARYAASVIIPCFNRAALLEKSLQALVTQNAGVSNFEVIVADDGSTDETFDVVRRFGALLNIKYTYYPDRGYHVTRARNVGLSLAEGDRCIFLDCGNIACSSFVSGHLAPGRGSKTVVLGYTFGYASTDDNADDVLAALDLSDIAGSMERLEALAMGDMRDLIYDHINDDVGSTSHPWAYCFGGNVSAPREMAYGVGGFDENYRSWGMEDVDFGYKLFCAGAQFAMRRDAAAIQYPHEKKIDTRTASHTNNVNYFAEKFKTAPARLFRERGWRGMPLR